MLIKSAKEKQADAETVWTVIVGNKSFEFMQIDRIEQQIETYTSSLTQAVHEGRGAQFSMLLSLIHNAEDLSQKQPRTNSAEFKLPEAEGLQYPDPDRLYTEEIAGRLNNSIRNENLGDYAYVVSHLDSQANTPANAELKQDYFARIGLASAGKLMLSEIEKSQLQFSATA